MNDYARCALARYDQLSYDLDSLPVLPCNPSCYPCGSCCGCPYPCPPTTPAPNPNPCPNAPSYLNAVNDPEQTVASGSPVLFATDRVSSGNCIQHTAGTSNFTLNCPGVYLVEYNANASVAGGTNVAVSLSLLSGGVIVPGTQSAETVDATRLLPCAHRPSLRFPAVPPAALHCPTPPQAVSTSPMPTSALCVYFNFSFPSASSSLGGRLFLFALLCLWDCIPFAARL